MTPRIGFAWRLALIVVAALVAMQLAAVAAYVVEHRNTSDFVLGPRLPDQIAALVRLADNRTPAERALIAVGASGPGVRIAFVDDQTPLPPLVGREILLFEAAVRRALGDGDRPVRVELARGLTAEIGRAHV